MDHEAALEFDYDDAERARRIERSVRPEIGEIGGERTRARLDRDGACLEVTIDAEDLIALRAGLNTWSGLVGVAERSGLGSVNPDR